jgi:murein DD-endopeptidase MepM/ murein hydrolase activator NlpD
MKLPLILALLLCLIACQEQVVKAPKIQPLVLKQEFVETRTGEVKKGQGLFQALRSVGISDDVLALDLINSLRDEVEFSKLKVGDKLEATFNQDNKLVSFSFSQNQAEKHFVKLSATGSWEYSFKEEPTVWKTRILEGELRPNSTLQEDLLAKELPRNVVAEVVNILLCKVNFRSHARMGDRFKVLLNERHYQGEAIETEVLYTSYEGKVAGVSESYFFRDEEKGSTYTAHYTSDGQALINSGIRYPLSRLHIRSGFGIRRHPVTGRRTMHRGVDLRGRVGTPVHAVASGTVIESTFNQFAGNKVRIRHRDGSSSYYMHLQKRRVKRGQWVKSYQVIGTVGATGRVTGPHLHFGFRKPSGQWMNPMKKRMIATPKLMGKRLRSLQSQITKTQSLLYDLELSQVSKYLLAKFPNRSKTQSIHWKLESLPVFKGLLEPQAKVAADRDFITF